MTCGDQLNVDEKIREDNFRVFEDRYGFRPCISHDESDRFTMLLSKDGDYVLRVNDVLPGVSVRMNSEYSPEYEADKWTEDREIPDRKTTIILYGLSTGIFLKALKKRLRPDTSYYVYEPDEGLFSFVCGYMDLREIISNPNVFLFISDEQKKGMTDDLLNDVVAYRPEIIRIETPFYNMNQEFEHICEEVSRLSIAQRNFRANRGREALKCRMYAWNHLQKGKLLRSLKGKIPEDIPAIIVAAGPSLNKNVGELKSAKNRALIICTDRAYNIMDENGIMPDFVISVDAIKSPEFVIKAADKNIPLISSYQTNVDIQKAFEGNILYFDEISYERMLLGNENGEVIETDLGGNVSGAAYVACKQLGIKKIILVGQDLAYLVGKHHADDRNDGMSEDIRKDDVYVDGIGSNKVRTNSMWIKFIDFFVRQAAVNSSIRLIDATEGGAYIKGTEVMTLEDAISEECCREYDLGKTIESLKHVQAMPAYENIQCVLKSWIGELEIIKELSTDLEEIFIWLEKKVAEGDNDEGIAQKLKAMTILRQNLAGRAMNRLLEDYWVEDIYSIPDGNLIIRNNDEAMKVFDEAAKYYSQLAKDSDSLRIEMQKAIEQGEKDN